MIRYDGQYEFKLIFGQEKMNNIRRKTRFGYLTYNINIHAFQ